MIRKDIVDFLTCWEAELFNYYDALHNICF